jgi:protein-disulfide isomerase
MKRLTINLDIWRVLIIFSVLLSLTNLFFVYKISSTGAFITNPQTGSPTQPQPSQPSPSQQKPQVVQVSVDDDPAKGSKDAPVVIVEFSDFQCPYCKRFFDQTLPQLENEYIKTGKVYFVYRDFPLNFHQYAKEAAEAANCAKEQGKFWEYHDLLFENQQTWTSVGISELKKYAADLGLDTNKFDSCLDSGKYASEVQKDFQDGLSYGVGGTPTFFINGIKIVGAQPYSVFKQIIDQQLSGS